MRATVLRLLVAAATLALAGRLAAAPAVDMAADPLLEGRVQRVASELRCLVCQNQSLADSHAGLAMDLKQQVREQLAAGRTDDEVVAYMTERYGDFVRYRPPLKVQTWLLWFGPPLLLAAGALALRGSLRRRHPAGTEVALSTEEQDLARRWLSEGHGD